MSDNNKDRLVFVPLGGSNEIGMNLNLYGFGPKGREKWIIVDFGVTFGDSSTPGVEVIYPDPTFIEERKKDLLAIILTHAHEDHMGAVAPVCKRRFMPRHLLLIRGGIGLPNMGFLIRCHYMKFHWVAVFLWAILIWNW